MTEDAFNFSKKMAKMQESANRKRQIEVLVNLENQMSDLKKRVDTEIPSMTAQEFYDKLRNDAIEEIAKDIEQMKGFGKDTIDSFAIYIRGMKKNGI